MQTRALAILLHYWEGLKKVINYKIVLSTIINTAIILN